MIKKPLAVNLRKVRHKLGWKKASTAAYHLGIPAGTYRAWEEGRGEPSAEMLCRIAEVMGIHNLYNFLKDPNFDFKQQDACPRITNEPVLMVNYRGALERDRKIVDLILNIP